MKSESKILTKRNFNIFTYVSIVIIIVLLLLILAKSVSLFWVKIFLGVSIFLFIVRIVLRIYFSHQDKKELGGG